jgi:hypothetical protein
MSLESAEGKVYFKANVPINLKKLAEAVVNAGFSVRFVKLQITFDTISLNSHGEFDFQNQSFRWINFQDKESGLITLLLVNEGFLPKKESVEWKKKYKLPNAEQNVLYVAHLR